ncbi:MAG: YcgN family cysteine cluster protein [Pseudomonadota bacterium]
MTTRFWETKPLAQMNRSEWESLCDGCGKCCLMKLEDADTGEVVPTNIACKLLDRDSCRCADYRNRKAFVPDCVRMTAATLDRHPWLPSTCAYRLVAEGRPLPDWHHLESGDPDAVHRAGQSARGWTISELDAGPIEHHLTDRVL